MKKVFLIVMLLLVVTLVNSESAKSGLTFAQDSPIKIIKPVVMESGWNIPGLDHSQITDTRKLVPQGFGPTAVRLHITGYTPRKKFITTIPRYRLKDDQTLIITERKVQIDGIIKCDVDGREFLYILHCTTILEEPNGRTGYSGVFGVQYSDRDGDGKFESFAEGAPFVTPDLWIPDWVTKNPTPR